MSSFPRRRRAARVTGRALLASLLLVASGGLAAHAEPAPPARAVPASIQIDGHGWGHGRGMGQFGAYGYAVDHGWSGTQILDHFYGGTVTSQMSSNPRQRVLLTGRDGLDLILYNPAGGMRISADGYRAHRKAVRIQRVGENRFQVYAGDTCGGPWTKWDRIVESKGLRAKPASSGGANGLLQLCLGSTVGTRYYRGDIIAVHSGGTMKIVNDVDTESLIRSVIAKEVSPSWADGGGGRGAAAVRAQAVAARSYVMAGDTRWGEIATTCDSTTCQVYQGYGFRRPFQQGLTKVEDARTDYATAATVRQIRRFWNGRVARTEFSSSSGGWTVAYDFPAVPDEGDDTSINPNHDWRVFVDREVLEDVFSFTAGRDLGDVQLVKVSARDGNGSYGGRATKVRALFTGGDVTVSGDDFRRMFGLKTTWFIVRSS